MKQHSEKKQSNARMYQRWEDLLFFHWEYPTDVVQETLPPGLKVDTFEGRAFLSIVAFTMKGLRPKGLPAIGGISNFLELNLRTYVVDEHGRPGVWFYSLDADSWLSVEIAQRFFHLPYKLARLTKSVNPEGALEYTSRAKRDRDSSGVRYQIDSIPQTSLEPASRGTLPFFWVERYHLFAWDSNHHQLWLGTITHKPYQIGRVHPLHVDTRLMTINGFPLPESSLESAYFSPGVDVTVYGFELVGGSPRERRRSSLLPF